MARELKAHLVVGYEEPAQPKPFNCAAIVGLDGRVKGTHRKIHPFLGERQGMQCGCEATAFPTDLGKVGMEICFDSCYPEVTRRIQERAERIRQEIVQEHGIVNVAVDLIREGRDEE